jgi:hypothetical protein
MIKNEQKFFFFSNNNYQMFFNEWSNKLWSEGFLEIDFDEFFIIQWINFCCPNILWKELVELILFELLAPHLIFNLLLLVYIDILNILSLLFLLFLDGIPLFINDFSYNILRILVCLIWSFGTISLWIRGLSIN